jgi:predicted anti-sigma-YlaC factor YlaD
MISPKNVGGLDCFEVLALLSAYLDGELDESLQRRVVAHVSGCTACASFGDRFARAIASLRQLGSESDGVPDDVAERLRVRLEVD